MTRVTQQDVDNLKDYPTKSGTEKFVKEVRQCTIEPLEYIFFFYIKAIFFYFKIQLISNFHSNFDKKSPTNPTYLYGRFCFFQWHVAFPLAYILGGEG